MNAELALWLVEGGMPVAQAREVAATATSPADIALALIDYNPNLTVAEARERAATAPLVVEVVRGKAVPSQPGPPALVREVHDGVVIHDDAEHAFRFYAPVTGPDGLTDAQRTAVQTGVGLCRNCQQPKDNHLPGCALHSGEDPKAITKSALPPAV